MLQDSKQSVALIQPSFPLDIHKNVSRPWENLGLGHLASATEQAGFKTLLIDAQVTGESMEELISKLAMLAPSVLGVSCPAQRLYPEAKRLACRVKSELPSTHICFGGNFPTLASDEIMKDCEAVDSVVRGEGEYIFVEIVRRVCAGSDLRGVAGTIFRRDGALVANDESDRIRDLDALPFPRRTILDGTQHLSYTGASIVSSRGCCYRCSFCTCTPFFRESAIVRRSVDKVLEEMLSLREEYKVHRFRFWDDTFITSRAQDKEWAREFASKLIDMDLGFRMELMATPNAIDSSIMALLARAGVDTVFLGVESAHHESLVRFRKGHTTDDTTRALQILKALRVRILLGFIMFEPDISITGVHENYEWLKCCDASTPANLTNRLNIYYGTPVHRKLRASKRLRGDSFLNRIGYDYLDERVAVLSGIVDQMREGVLSDLARARARLEALNQRFASPLAEPQGGLRAGLMSVIELQQEIARFEKDSWFLAFGQALEAVESGGAAGELREANYLGQSCEKKAREYIAQANELVRGAQEAFAAS